ncbi:MAG: hypothetical protein M3131_00625 [Actinomycetota bacterium]|nr:hypothetical protein [Actinomycetota bacterium]
MLWRFAEPARRVVRLAHEEARYLDRNYIGAEHLLLGLVREAEGGGARVLKSLGATIEPIRAQVMRLTERNEGLTSEDVAFTPGASRVLELALCEAHSLRHPYIYTEHILLALVSDRESIGARLLLDQGIDEQLIRTEVNRMLATRDVEARPAPRVAEAMRPLPLGVRFRMALERVQHRERLALARLRHEIRRGSRSLAAVLLDPPPEANRARVADLMLVAPSLGRLEVNTALDQVQISPTATVGALADDQRHKLVSCLRGRGDDGATEP